MFEELLALGYKDAEYDAWLIKIIEGEQFSSGFVLSIPTQNTGLTDVSTEPTTRVFDPALSCSTSRRSLVNFAS